MHDANEARRILEHRRSSHSPLNPMNLHRRYLAMRYYAEHMHAPIMSDFHRRLSKELMTADPNEEFDPSFNIYGENKEHWMNIAKILGIDNFKALINHTLKPCEDEYGTRFYIFSNNQTMKDFKARLFHEPNLFFLFRPLLNDVIDKGYILHAVTIDSGFSNPLFIYFRIKLPT